MKLDGSGNAQVAEEYRNARQGFSDVIGAYDLEEPHDAILPGFVASRQTDVIRPDTRTTLDLTSLQLFVRAIELGSLSKTAEYSNLALAAVSRRITMLEAQYGVRLLDRSGRGVTPTPAGGLLLSRASDILRQVKLASSELFDYSSGVRGSISLQASTSAITHLLPNDLAKFAREYPDIRLDIRERRTSEIAARLRDRTIEVGILVAGPATEGLRILPYRRDRLVVAAPAGFRTESKNIRLRDLEGEDFVLMEDNSAITRLLASVAADRGVTLRAHVQVASFDAMCRMVENGFGIGVLPVRAAEPFAGMGLRLIGLDECWAERQMVICTNPLVEPSQAAARLIRFLAEVSAN